MHRLLSLTALFTVVFTPFAFSQQTPDITTLKTTARLVTVDVSVTDSKGAGIPGLTCADFQLTDKKAPQTLTHCEDHTNAVAAATAPPAALPPNVFTNANAVALPPTLDVFVFDFVDTGSDIGNVSKMKQAVNDLLAAPIPGHRIAVFALGDKLQLLSGFSDDPASSKAAVKEKLASALPGYTSAGIAGGRRGPGKQVAALAQEQSLTSTVEQMRAIAAFLAPLPGRKRLIWVAGGSAFNFGSPFNMESAAHTSAAWEEFQKLSAALVENRIQVFPVDVSGVVNNYFMAGYTDSKGIDGNNNKFTNMGARAQQDEVIYHNQMDTIAADTGGKAFYGSNSVEDLYKKALNYGNQFYTLTYTPNNFQPDGSFHELKVSVTNSKDRLTYRRGYLTSDEKAEAAAAKAALEEEKAIGKTLPPRTPAQKESSVAMMRGLPDTTSLLFSVRIVPPSKNQMPAEQKAKGPRVLGDRYGVDLSVNTSDIGWAPKDNLQTANLKVRMAVYDQQNRFLGESDVPTNLHLDEQQFAKAKAQGLQIHFDVPLKLAPGSHLRLGIEDVASHHIGTVEIANESLVASAAGE